LLQKNKRRPANLGSNTRHGGCHGKGFIASSVLKKTGIQDEREKMAKIPEEVQEFLKNKMAWVATASPDGLPNATPKGTVQLLDDEHLVFADLFSLKTRENLQKNPKAAVTVVDEKTHKGYQLKGSVELIDSGPLFDKIAGQLEKASKQLPKPK
jgi:predicted pyridoxine 5'-phosphate oxidase superfamily flavin-nucleotide-binding protein